MYSGRYFYKLLLIITGTFLWTYYSSTCSCCNFVWPVSAIGKIINLMTLRKVENDPFLYNKKWIILAHC